MKKFWLPVVVFSLLFSIQLLTSCDKMHHDRDENEVLCPVVVDSLVPQAVKDSFAFRFPATSVQTWFYKDSSSYCALFGIVPQQQLAQFALDGTFIKIVTEEENEAAENSTDTAGGIKNSHFTCECEVEHEHHH